MSYTQWGILAYLAQSLLPPGSCNLHVDRQVQVLLSRIWLFCSQSSCDRPLVARMRLSRHVKRTRGMFQRLQKQLPNLHRGVLQRCNLRQADGATAMLRPRRHAHLHLVCDLLFRKDCFSSTTPQLTSRSQRLCFSMRWVEESR